MEGWQECLDLICAIILATAGLTVAVRIARPSHFDTHAEHTPPSMATHCSVSVCGETELRL